MWARLAAVAARLAIKRADSTTGSTGRAGTLSVKAESIEGHGMSDAMLVSVLMVDVSILSEHLSHPLPWHAPGGMGGSNARAILRIVSSVTHASEERNVLA